MKRKIVPVLIFALLNLWIPCASAGMSQDLDPMVSPDAQETVTSESAANTAAAGQTGNAVSAADASKGEKKVEGTHEKKTKKDSSQKSASKKSKKTVSKKSKTSKKNSH